MLNWSENSEDITPNGCEGVKKIILKESSDKNGFLPLHRDVVKVHYKGFFEDGTCFTKSGDIQEARTFVLGQGDVLLGWEVAVATMKLNEVSVFRLAPEYAYGDSGLPPQIAPGTTVYFELELLSIEGEHVTKDGSVTRSVLLHGPEGKSPLDNDVCTVSYKTQLYSDPSVVIEDVKRVTFVLGEGFDVGVPHGVEKALKRMGRGERSRLKVRCGSGLRGREEIGVPAMSDLVHFVELHDFTETKKHWEMTREELLKNGFREREAGLCNYEAGKYQTASRHFSRCLLYAESVNLTSSELESLARENPMTKLGDGGEPEEEEGLLPEGHPFRSDEGMDWSNGIDVRSLWSGKRHLTLTSLLNLSISNEKIGRHLKALSYATRALEVDPKNVKALYRRAVIYYRLKSYDEARESLTMLLELRPKMTTARRMLEACNRTLRDQTQKNKSLFKDMFDKFATEDAMKDNENGPKRDIFTEVGEWDNQMADGMMTLEQEMAAFGETMPEKGYNKENDNPGSDDD